MVGGVRSGSARPAARGKRVPLALCSMLFGAVLALAGGASAEDLARADRGAEHRCAPYDPDDYPYPQSVERDIIARVGGRIYGPYTQGARASAPGPGSVVGVALAPGLCVGCVLCGRAPCGHAVRCCYA